MKRSENVGLVLMGAAAFAATFAGGMTYFAWQKPSHAAQAQTETVVDQRCTAVPDGTQDCAPQRRSFAYYVFPHFTPGWTWSSGWGWGSSYDSSRGATALSNNSRTNAPTRSGGIQRSGFGSSARGSFRVSAGG
jgi:hypothetical protein